MHDEEAAKYDVGLGGWITIRQAHELSGYSSMHLWRLAITGRLKAVQVEQRWFIFRDSLLGYMNEMRELGNKKFMSNWLKRRLAELNKPNDAPAEAGGYEQHIQEQAGGLTEQADTP